MIGILCIIMSMTFPFYCLGAATSEESAKLEEHFRVIFCKPNIDYRISHKQYTDKIIIRLAAHKKVARSSSRSFMRLAPRSSTESLSTDERKSSPHSPHLLKRHSIASEIANPPVNAFFIFTKRSCIAGSFEKTEADKKTFSMDDDKTVVLAKIEDQSATWDFSFYKEAYIKVLQALTEEETIEQLKADYIKEIDCDIAIEIDRQALANMISQECSPEHEMQLAQTVHTNQLHSDKPKSYRCAVL